MFISSQRLMIATKYPNRQIVFTTDSVSAESFKLLLRINGCSKPFFFCSLDFCDFMQSWYCWQAALTLFRSFLVIGTSSREGNLSN